MRPAAALTARVRPSHQFIPFGRSERMRRMARKHPNRRLPGWLSLRRRAALVPVAVALVGLLVAVTAAGWAGWLLDHPGQAWQWVVRHWFVPPALAVVVALLTAWATWAAPRAQQRRAEQLAKVQHARQERLEQERLARQREQAAAARQAAWARRCRELLARWPLPAVEEVDPYEVGVFYSRRADAYRGQQPRPPYVPRAVDQELAALLDSQPLVLLKGRSRAGKSRTAFEVAVHVLAGWRLLVPKDRAALTQLRDLQPLPGEGERILVWLDDLDQYLATEGTGGLDAGLLARLAACDPPMQVLATIRLEEHARLSAAPGELGRAVRGLLNRFDPGAVTLPVGFDEPAERAAISELYPDEAVSGGLAEHLAAAHELVDWLEHGEATVPEGAGLVLAAVDRRRAGLDRPASREDLAALLPLYLQQLRPLVPFQKGDVARGLAWATEPLGRTAALLVADPGPPADSFRVAEPIVDHVERRTGRRLTIAAVWDRLLAGASLEEAMALGFAAYTRGERRPAEAALRQVVDSGDPDLAPSASFNLGVLLIDEGDVAGARAALQQAINSGHPHEAPMAAGNLGLLLLEERDVAGARAAFQLAVESGDAEAAPMGAVGTGLLR